MNYLLKSVKNMGGIFHLVGKPLGDDILMFWLLFQVAIAVHVSWLGCLPVTCVLKVYIVNSPLYVFPRYQIKWAKTKDLNAASLLVNGPPRRVTVKFIVHYLPICFFSQC